MSFVTAFDSKGLTFQQLDDFSLKIFYRGVKVETLKYGLSHLALQSNSTGYELIKKAPCNFEYLMHFNCAANTRIAMRLMSEVRKGL